MAELSIVQTRPAAPEEWDKIWGNCDYATYFHSRQWAEIWQTYTQGFYQPVPELITFSDNKQAVLPFSLQKRKKFVKTYFLTADGQFGNWISLDPLDKNHVSLLTDHIHRKCHNLVWRLNPYDPVEVEISHPNIYKLEEDENFAVDLTCGFEQVLKGCYHGHRCSYQKGKKEGLTIRRAETEEDWRQYYGAYEDTLRRWGDSTLSQYEWDLFRIIYENKSIHVHLWLAIHNTAVVAGALCFTAKHHVVCWHAAVLEKFFPLRPMNYMFLEIMKEMSAIGYECFDFSTSAHLEGLQTFKKRFGAREFKCNVIYKKAIPMRTYIKLKQFIQKATGAG